MVVWKIPITWTGWNRLAEKWSRFCQHTNDDLTQIKVLANTITATWLDEFVKVYLNNYLAGKQNDSSIHKLDSKIVFFNAQDSKKILKQIDAS